MDVLYPLTAIRYSLKDVPFRLKDVRETLADVLFCFTDVLKSLTDVLNPFTDILFPLFSGRFRDSAEGHGFGIRCAPVLFLFTTLRQAQGKQRAQRTHRKNTIMSGDYFPSREAELVTWSNNLNSHINATPAQYGLTAGQAATFAGLHHAFKSAYQIANDPGTRTPSAIVTKNDCKEALINSPGGIRDLVRIIQNYSGTTNAMRADLGITVRDTEPRDVVSVPSSAPDVSILSTFGRLIKVRLRDQDSPDRRGKPTGARGAVILYQVADSAEPGHTSPVSDPAKWTFGMITSRTVFDIEIPASVAAGSRVWLTAFWFNARKDSSPYATPETTIIGDGVSRLAA